MFDPEDEKVKEIGTQILDILKLPEDEVDKWKMRLSTALLVDGISMFYDVIKDLGHNGIEVQNLECQDMESWRYGYTIANQLKTVFIYLIINRNIKLS